ncbi:MAG TPA: electron transport complex subunit RsxC [Spirochaetia bacterium]|nr:electron transport complex subunit RsxC [Spirochaetia bacterium]
MLGIRTFRGGGVFPYERKSRTRDKRIWNAAIPGIAVIPFLQHSGTPAVPLVRQGDRVREGMLIGRPAGEDSAAVHSPIPGIVQELVNVVLPNGNSSLAALVALDGEFDRLGKETRSFPWENLTPEELIDAIANRGVVGMGGESVPTRQKYLRARQAGAETLIVNGVESEPYVCADYRLMIEKAAEIVEGIRIAEKALGVKHVFFAISNGRSEAAEAVGTALRSSGSQARLIQLQDRYPQGDEKELVRAITGKEVPSGGSPLDTGTVVSNVATVFAIYEAVVLQKPLIDRVVTVAGGAVRNPGNLKVRLGTPLADLIEECGGFRHTPARIVVGGPMTGLGIFDLSIPVTKGTRAVLALSEAEVGDATETACIQCGRCVRACPMGLEPTILYKYIDHQQYDRAVAAGLADCHECGACAYVCPAHIPLVQGLKVGKRVVDDRIRTREAAK